MKNKSMEQTYEWGWSDEQTNKWRKNEETNEETKVTNKVANKQIN